jgi:hypothetical protein
MQKLFVCVPEKNRSKINQLFLYANLCCLLIEVSCFYDQNSFASIDDDPLIALGFTEFVDSFSLFYLENQFHLSEMTLLQNPYFSKSFGPSQPWTLNCIFKGQIISKGLFGVLEFSQKTNEQIRRSSKNEFKHTFVCSRKQGK